jgi:hypothetical protein
MAKRCVRAARVVLPAVAAAGGSGPPDQRAVLAYPARRRTVALAHHWSSTAWLPSGDVEVFAHPLTPTPEAELGLRRIADEITDGDSIAAHIRYAEAVAQQLPGVSVAHVTGRVAPRAMPFDLDSLSALTDETMPAVAGWMPGMRLWWLTDLESRDI